MTYMNFLRRRVFLIHFIMIALLILWLLVVRPMINGRPGWDILMLIVFIVPAVIVFTGIVVALLKSRLDVMKTKMVGWVDVVLLWIVYMTIFLGGFFMPYYGDGDYWYNESYNRSVAMVIMGISKNQTIQGEYISFWVGIAAAIVTLAILIYERVKRRSL